ncbi:agmatine deiminase family protein [Sporolactobacillus sp. CQH2019]|uniref:agmatine deiminase family protein n=1 Tax=Sporolactobacillus sp. CQH2019 TaxID=3023512 RepID=UPI0023681C6A|nr:agmatine deiminase family protein [Sporolactobacillus sp. CQH2019]MDD9150341.1 agmatine deiminase family protein [Sporolactobacillus sp. CQH2019]
MNPIDLHFRMPAEWETHERTFISWPVRESMCFPENYESVCRGYAAFIQAISEFEPVTVIVNPAEWNRVKVFLNGLKAEILAIDHNDSWIRDNGPTFLINGKGQRAGVNWVFNAWGEKYASWELDDRVAPAVLDHFRVRRFDAPLVLEGGSIHVDGEGTLLTTEECLLHPNRNPDRTRSGIEAALGQFLNIRKVIWLKRGLSGDETDGHVDNVACFAAPGRILMQVCDDPQDENYGIVRENLDILGRATDAKGRKLEVVAVRQPPKREYKGARLTLSYLNFYFVNHGIILPVFGSDAEETDRMAEKVLKDQFPDRVIRKVDGTAIIKEGGNVHCATQQMPLP